MKTVTFCGHGEIDFVNGELIRDRLNEVIVGLIKKGANEFLLGGYGTFDTLSAEMLTNLKKNLPKHSKNIGSAIHGQRV